MKLKLDFTDEKVRQNRRKFTTGELADLSAAAQGISALTEVLLEYSVSGNKDEGVYTALFTVMGWLIEPVENYLFEYVEGEG